jgi:hypothetical protein
VIGAHVLVGDSTPGCRKNASVTVAIDGCLPAALDRLYGAVSALVDERKELHDGALLAAPSLYEQLVGEVPATVQRDGYARGHSRSLPTIWVDALDLLSEIDDTVRVWEQLGVSTPTRLRVFASRGWRPQDTREIEERAGTDRSVGGADQRAAEPGVGEALQCSVPSMRR